MSIPTRKEIIKRLESHLLIMRCTEPFSEQWLESEDIFLNLLMFNSEKLLPEERRKFDSFYQNTSTAYSQENQLIAVA